MTKKALITGITGQDGSYLAELLLSKGYEVHGLIRRASTFNTERIDHLYRDPHDPGVRLFLHFGDLTDGTNLRRIIEKIQPHEIYNLGAQSHVKVSFDQPEYTADVDATGTLRLLEAARDYRNHSGVEVRIYQAGSSEMFGASPPPQSEATPFHPRSPYAVSKVAAFWYGVNYREAYDLFVANGILFNHECIADTTPLIVRRDGSVQVERVVDLVALRLKGASVQTFEPEGLEVWDGRQWTPVRAITATRRRRDERHHALHAIEARGGIVTVTGHHRMLREDRSEVAAVEVAAGDRLALAEAVPEAPGWVVLSAELAELLGYLAADGYVPSRGSLQFTNNDPALRERVADLWRRVFMGTARDARGVSGWRREEAVGQLYLNGGAPLCEWLRAQLYTDDGHKRVPPLVLNAPLRIQEAFLDAYYAGDGLKAGNGKSIKTNSEVLALGLWWLYRLRGARIAVYAERRGAKTYYQLNLGKPDDGTPAKGSHLRRPLAEVRRVVQEGVPESEWVFDLETQSGVFCAGVGGLVVHNSPRRGETFVTRKITRAATRIKLGLQEKLYLGNLDARRDWGFAGDYVEAMWRMLQHDTPDDFVVATGRSHSVRDFVVAVFDRLELDWERYVAFDPRYLRPSEVDALEGDASKARSVLGWEPKVDFDALVERMVEHDLELARQEQTLRDAGHEVGGRRGAES